MIEHTLDQEKATRRQFAKGIVLLATAPLATGRVISQETRSAPEPAMNPAQAFAEVLRQRYGRFLTEEQLSLVKQSLDANIRTAERLKQFKLANGDEPAFVFSAEVSP